MPNTTRSSRLRSSLSTLSGWTAVWVATAAIFSPASSLPSSIRPSSFGFHAGTLRRAPSALRGGVAHKVVRPVHEFGTRLIRGVEELGDGLHRVRGFPD